MRFFRFTLEHWMRTAHRETLYEDVIDIQKQKL